MSLPDNPTDPIELISKVLAGEASESEALALEAWRAAEEANEEQYRQYRRAWESVTGPALPHINLDEEWQKLRARTLAVPTGGKVISMSSQRPVLYRAMRLAAVWLLLLAPLGALLYYLAGRPQSVIVAQSKVTDTLLTDGSQIALNKGATLIIERGFGKKQRKVKLKGEAFFEVSHDASRPFVIDAGGVDVKVLGTSFYVNSGESGNSVEVVLHSGKVEVTEPGGSRLILAPGEKAEYNKTTHAFSKASDADPNHLSWRTLQLVFNNKRFGNVIQTLEKIYGVTIAVSDKEVLDCRITVSFDQQDIDKVLKVLEATLNIKTTKDANHISISGKGCQ